MAFLDTLEGSIDREEYYLRDIKKIFGILASMVEE
jgi:hypothetical protein